MITYAWHLRYLALADHIATWSKDSTKVGCVIVGPDKEIRAQGYNGIPRGARDDIPERAVRPEKYLYSEHAERNAIFNAARVGTPLQGCTMYTTLHPCCDCCRAAIQSGVETIVTRAPDFNLPVWGEHFKRGIELLHECKVAVLYV